MKITLLIITLTLTGACSNPTPAQQNEQSVYQQCADMIKSKGYDIHSTEGLHMIGVCMDYVDPPPSDSP